jgi:hypothetical protein
MSYKEKLKEIIEKIEIARPHIYYSDECTSYVAAGILNAMEDNSVEAFIAAWKIVRSAIDFTGTDRAFSDLLKCVLEDLGEDKLAKVMDLLDEM